MFSVRTLAKSTQLKTVTNSRRCWTALVSTSPNGPRSQHWTQPNNLPRKLGESTRYFPQQPTEFKAWQCRYPVLIRPSYVLSGAAMNVVHEEAALEYNLSAAASVSP